jgi:hypothetical protein
MGPGPMYSPFGEAGATLRVVPGIEGTVSLRVLGSAPAAAVAEPVLLALGARAGLDVGRLDELAMAVELAIHRAGRPLLIELTPNAGRLTVAVRPLEPAGLRECEQLVHPLVGAVEVDGEGLVMRAG